MRICDTCINNMIDHSSNQYYCWFRKYNPDTEYWDNRWNGKEQDCKNYDNGTKSNAG